MRPIDPDEEDRRAAPRCASGLTILPAKPDFDAWGCDNSRGLDEAVEESRKRPAACAGGSAITGAPAPSCGGPRAGLLAGPSRCSPLLIGWLTRHSPAVPKKPPRNHNCPRPAGDAACQ